MLARSANEAMLIASQLGYPVVLKPVNLDQGVGVEAGLRGEAELRVAHGRSSQHARVLLVEKHVWGEDYRVDVMLGEVVGVAHRTPARVVGDGARSMADLVAAANREREALGGAAMLFKPIELDDESGGVPDRGVVVGL